MYHSYSKDNLLVRKALYEAYSRKCTYCGNLLKPKNMHVDHILATNSKKTDDDEFNQYIDELMANGFILDSIENYLPSCAACNLSKNNSNFSVANLRFFHDRAQKNTGKILSIISQYKDQKITFDGYDPDYDYWEKVDFSHQKDISEAIAGYRLQPCHVCACPRLVQVDAIKKRLDIVDYVIVEGEPGCGKSISVYQAAYDLSSLGYIVYRYINKNAEDTIFLPQSNKNKYLIIIDDAQNIPQFTLEHIISQCKKQTKIIIAFTHLKTDTHSFPEPIRITNFDSVETITQDYTKRKQEILPIIRKFDRLVGDELMDISFESRIIDASTKNTPWLFNYTLRGGWNTTNEQFQTVYNHNKCGLLSVMIALFQILKMDNTIDFKWLQTYILRFDDTISWTEDDLNYLIKTKLVASSDDVRIVHIESARVIIHSFFKVADDSSQQLICRILEEAYKDQIITELGLLWLYNTVNFSTYCLREFLFTESLLHSVFSDLEAITNQERRGHIAFFLERIYNLDRERNGKYYFKQSEHIFIEWISSVTSKNAYAYSQLLNALINERNDHFKTFVSKIDITALIQRFSDSSIEDIYAWCKLFNRFTYAYDTIERAEFSELIREPLITKSQFVTVNNVSTFYFSMSVIFYLNKEFILDLLMNKIELFQQLWLSKIEEAIEIFDFHFMDLCGLSHFTIHKPTRKQREFSKKFVDVFPIIPIANYISHSMPRDWNTIYEIGRLLYRENKKLYGKIVKAINYGELNKCTSSLWQKTNSDLHLLFCFIAAGDQSSAQQFFKTNMEKIEELGLPFIEIMPEQAIELFKKGVKIRLFEHYWNSVSLCALKALHDISETEYRAILNSEVSQLAAKISEYSILDFDKNEKSLTEILTYIKSTHPDVISGAVSLLDYEKMKKEKLLMLKNERYNRKSKRQFNEMIDILIEFSDETNIGKLELLKKLK